MSTTAKPRILAVDDVPQNTRLLEAVLTGHSYEVVSASSGSEALEQVGKQIPDLVLLDIEMPDMNGYDVCRRLRADEATAFVPVVMLTSSGRVLPHGQFHLGGSWRAAHFCYRPDSPTIDMIVAGALPSRRLLT